MNEWRSDHYAYFQVVCSLSTESLLIEPKLCSQSKVLAQSLVCWHHLEKFYAKICQALALGRKEIIHVTVENGICHYLRRSTLRFSSYVRQCHHEVYAWHLSATNRWAIYNLRQTAFHDRNGRHDSWTRGRLSYPLDVLIERAFSTINRATVFGL